ncbi:MAG: hypothetical protein J6C77_01040 [Muribaculaceae bacterium]|nr:hypothetical protein [Muribaculaceae bacterium]
MKKHIANIAMLVATTVTAFGSDTAVAGTVLGGAVPEAIKLLGVEE